MSAQCEITGKQAAGARLSFFERYLTAWVVLCIVVGIALGQSLPGVFRVISNMEIANVNLPVGVSIEVPVMLLVVSVVNRTKRWYEDEANPIQSNL